VCPQSSPENTINPHPPSHLPLKEGAQFSPSWQDEPRIKGRWEGVFLSPSTDVMASALLGARTARTVGFRLELLYSHVIPCPFLWKLVTSEHWCFTWKFVTWKLVSNCDCCCWALRNWYVPDVLLIASLVKTRGRGHYTRSLKPPWSPETIHVWVKT
jgi:hypothetical protein